MKETLKHLRSSLRPLYGDRETEAIIRLIFQHVQHWNLTDMLIHADDKLFPYVREEIDNIITRLLKHEPIQYITGIARFHGINFYVKPGVLIPRRETDELTDIIIDYWQNIPDISVLDLCTGSGCIAISLSRNLKFPKVTAVDNSEVAIEMARKNAEVLRCDIEVVKADIFNWNPSGNYDIIVANPPYVGESEAAEMDKNVLDFEPHEAIFVPDSDPLLYYSRIADISLQHFSDFGILYLEINPLHYKELLDLMKSKGFKLIKPMKDSAGKIRFLVCYHPY